MTYTKLSRRYFMYIHMCVCICMYKYENKTKFQNLCKFLHSENFTGRKYRPTSYPCNTKIEVLIEII